MASDKDATTEKIFARRDNISESEHVGETSAISHYSGHPLLPLPPQDHHHRNIQTEDRMGTLHNAFIDTKYQQGQSSGSSHIPSDTNTKNKLTPDQVLAPRFVPRTTHLDISKRKMEDSVESLLTEVSGKNEPLIGPKLPEPPKLDMEDESLNTTVRLIRNTMTEVTYNLICL